MSDPNLSPSWLDGTSRGYDSRQDLDDLDRQPGAWIAVGLVMGIMAIAAALLV